MKNYYITAKGELLIVRYLNTATRECREGIVGLSPTKIFHLEMDYVFLKILQVAPLIVKADLEHLIE